MENHESLGAVSDSIIAARTTKLEVSISILPTSMDKQLPS